MGRQFPSVLSSQSRKQRGRPSFGSTVTNAQPGKAHNQLEQRLFDLFRRELFDQGIIKLVSTDIRPFLAGPRTWVRVISRSDRPPFESGGGHLGRRALGFLYALNARVFIA